LIAARTRSRRRCRRAGSILVVALLFCCGARGASQASGADWRFDGVGRIVAFGDVHGDHGALVALLQRAGVVDDELAWRGGRTHVVSLGDLLDRGPDSRRVMDLLRRLQDEAERAGGRVHLVLGNHELMNLTGDVRYVAPGEWAAFAGPEDDRLRAGAIEAARGEGLDAQALAARPPGYYAHRAAFAPDGAYGAWLLAQRVWVRINGWLFLHGGLAPAGIPALLPGESGQDEMAGLEARLRAPVGELVRLRSRLPLGGTEPVFGDLLALAEPGSDADSEGFGEGPAAATVPAPLRTRLAELAAAPAFAPEGPAWYRGNAACPAPLESPSLTAALPRVGARGVVVGHTPTPDRRVHARLDGRVLLLDTGMLASHYGGSARAVEFLWSEPQAPVRLRVFSVAEDQDRVEPLRSAVDQGMDPDAVEQLLRTGTTAPRPEAGDGFVTVRGPQGEVLAKVLRMSGGARQRELAARRLDRVLGLGMVPAVAERRVDGRTVLLRVEAEGFVDEARRARAGVPVPDWCARGHVFDLVRFFDALLGLPGRAPADLAYRPADWQLRLTGHGDAFPRTRRLPDGDVPSLWTELAAAVDAQALRDAMAGILDARRIDALVARLEALRQPELR
jgi:hypothetical protein